MESFGTISLNPLAILVAAGITFAIGGLWYSPALFARPWMRAVGLTESDLRRRNPLPIFGGSLVGAVVAAVVLAMFLGPSATPLFGAVAGLLVGLGWVAPALTTVYLFESRPLGLIAIDSGYHVVSFTLMGLIVGTWH